MKYIRAYEASKYELDDYIIPTGDNPKNSYTIIDEVGDGFYDYMVSTFDINTKKQLERFPILDKEIIRKLTPEEIETIETKFTANKFNI